MPQPTERTNSINASPQQDKAPATQAWTQPPADVEKKAQADKVAADKALADKAKPQGSYGTQT